MSDILRNQTYIADWEPTRWVFWLLHWSLVSEMIFSHASERTPRNPKANNTVFRTCTSQYLLHASNSLFRPYMLVISFTLDNHAVAFVSVDPSRRILMHGLLKSMRNYNQTTAKQNTTALFADFMEYTFYQERCCIKNDLRILRSLASLSSETPGIF